MELSAVEIENEELAQEFLRVEVATKKAMIELSKARLAKAISEVAVLTAT